MNEYQRYCGPGADPPGSIMLAIALSLQSEANVANVPLPVLRLRSERGSLRDASWGG